jgi:hypothetical protein
VISDIKMPGMERVRLRFQTGPCSVCDLENTVESFLVMRDGGAVIQGNLPEKLPGMIEQRLIRENHILVRQVESQGENDFSFGFHATDFAAFDSIDGHRGYTGKTSQLHLAQQATLSDLTDVVAVLHAPSPRLGRISPRIVRRISVRTEKHFYDNLAGMSISKRW